MIWHRGAPTPPIHKVPRFKIHTQQLYCYRVLAAQSVIITDGEL